MSKRESLIVTTEEIKSQEVYIENLAETVKNKFGTRKPLVNITTWGCQMNEHDSENIFGMLEKIGYEITQDQSEADLIIYNTCAVRENAELKVYGNLHVLRRYKEKNPDLIIAVCGCMMQQPHVVEEIKNIYPHVNLVFGTHNIYKFPELLKTVMESDKTMYDVWDIDGQIVEGLPTQRKHDIKAFVNIMYGCNNFCTYCIVPYTRGRERSRNPEDIISEAKRLVEGGVKEITLLGQNVNSYGKTFTPQYPFHKLLEDINNIEGLERIRFMTSHPKDISDEVIDAISNLDKLCENLHLPIQSGSSRLLKEMRRHYTKEDYLEIIKKVKNKVNDIGITTDIMVGFPGETEEDFVHTMDVVEKVQYDLAFTYLYSVRKGTVAENMENHVDAQTKKDRFDRLLSVVNEAAIQTAHKYQDKVVEVLVEGVSKKNPEYMMGRNRQNKLVNFKGTEDLVGKLVNVKVTEPRSFSLIGEMI